MDDNIHYSIATICASLRGGLILVYIEWKSYHHSSWPIEPNIPWLAYSVFR